MPARAQLFLSVLHSVGWLPRDPARGCCPGDPPTTKMGLLTSTNSQDDPSQTPSEANLIFTAMLEAYPPRHRVNNYHQPRPDNLGKYSFSLGENGRWRKKRVKDKKATLTSIICHILGPSTGQNSSLGSSSSELHFSLRPHSHTFPAVTHDKLYFQTMSQNRPVLH